MSNVTSQPLTVPRLDPTPIFEAFRGSYGTELLTAAVAEFQVFEILATGPQSFEDLRRQLNIEQRPAVVLLTVLRAMGLVRNDETGKLGLTDLSREHLVAGSDFFVGDYIGLAASSPGVREMIERLRTNRPAGAADDEDGAAFIYREGLDSAMEAEQTARFFTLALAGRAKNVAPVLAERVSMAGVNRLLDVGGGTGIYSIALLRKNPDLRAVVLDRPEVLKVAGEMADEYGVADRVELHAADMFTDPMPSDCEAILISNVLHDWDVPQCRQLIQRCAGVLPAGGALLIHDVFLHDALDGPLPLALYSAALFTLTEGRAYSAAEYRSWLTDAELTAGEIVPTLIHCGVMTARK
jgi:predicted O-methyltransferase YrrM